MSGVYPKLFDSVEFIPEGQEYGDEFVKDVLESDFLKGVTSPIQKKKLRIFGGEPMMEIKNIKKQCNGIQHRVENHLVDTAEKYDKLGKYDDLYEMIITDFELGSSVKIDFNNAHFYIDDYMTAKKLNAKTTKDFKDPAKAMKLIKQYEEDYLYDGIMGTN